MDIGIPIPTQTFQSNAVGNSNPSQIISNQNMNLGNIPIPINQARPDYRNLSTNNINNRANNYIATSTPIIPIADNTTRYTPEITTNNNYTPTNIAPDNIVRTTQYKPVVTTKYIPRLVTKYVQVPVTKLIPIEPFPQQSSLNTSQISQLSQSTKSSMIYEFGPKKENKNIIMFETTSQNKVNISIDSDKTMEDLIKYYFQLKRRPDLYGDKSINFIMNGNVILHNSKDLIKNYIKLEQDKYVIVVNDVEDKLNKKFK